VSQQLAPVSLGDIQRPVAGELELVAEELRRIITADFPIIAEVNEHLLRMKGKLFRPTLLLLSQRASGAEDARTVTLAAVVELIHLATLVHDDSVDHSVLRRGMPTINALFSHQVAVIMGDYLYSRAIIELVGLDDLVPLRVFARVTNEMTIGEMRQLEAHDKLAYDEAQSAPRPRHSWRVRARWVRSGPRRRIARPWGASACGSGWRSRSPTICSITPSAKR